MDRHEKTTAGAQTMLSFIFFFIIVSLSGSCRAELVEDESSPIMEITAPMKSREREALYSAIRGFVGSWWNGSELYPDPCGWTPIQGVSCELYDGLWYVSGMNIGPVYENSLRCARNPEFTTHLLDLRRLTGLSFYSCFTSPRHGSTTMSDLPWERLSGTLESLEFRSNPSLTGSLPSSLGRLQQLRSLVVLENGMDGELPSEIGNLTRLKRLVLSGNRFTGRIPSSLGGLTNLLIVDFSRNSLSGSIPLTFGELTSLLKLDLSENNLHGFLPNEIGNLKDLTLMDLGSNNFSGGLVRSIHEMSSLSELVLSNNPMLGGDLVALKWADLRNLQVLDLANTGLTGPIPESITDIVGLRYLGVGQNRLFGTPPVRLASLPRLNTLYLDRNNLSGKLRFPESFYKRMKWRFKAEDNPNLCHEAELHIPLGVKPCLPDNSSVHQELLVGNLSVREEDLYRKPQIAVSRGHRNINGLAVMTEILVVAFWIVCPRK